MVVDPTNAALGVYKDGKIYMSFTKTGEGIEEAMLGQIMIFPENIIEVNGAIIKSLITTDLSLEELEGLYGLEAQNKALEALKEIYKKEGGNKALEILKNSNTQNILEQLEFQDPNKQFREKYKIDINDKEQENNIANEPKTQDLEQER